MGTVTSPQPDQQLVALKGLVTADGLDACVEVCASYFRKITQKVRLDPLEIADPLASVYHAVRERLPERVNMLEVADEIGLSEARLRDLLKTRLGLSFPKLVTGLRIERAKALLAETKLDIQEVARRVGIDDLSNFAKAFRAIEGMSPGEYRSSRIR
jgi:AraC-like DNA-binding protein